MGDVILLVERWQRRHRAAMMRGKKTPNSPTHKTRSTGSKAALKPAVKAQPPAKKAPAKPKAKKDVAENSAWASLTLSSLV